jgi:predicted secreted protein
VVHFFEAIASLENKSLPIYYTTKNFRSSKRDLERRNVLEKNRIRNSFRPSPMPLETFLFQTVEVKKKSRETRTTRDITAKQQWSRKIGTMELHNEDRERERI